MHLRRYMFAALLLIGAVGYYVYHYVTPSIYTLDLFGHHVTLPIAAWIAVAMGLLFVASFFHMLYYGIKAYFRRKRVSKDIEKLADALFWDILEAPKRHHYTDKRIRPIGAVLDVGCDDVTKIEKKSIHPLVRDAIDVVTAIRHGEVLDLSRFKLDKSNPLVIQNGLNMLTHEPERAEEVLRRVPYYDRRVIDQAMRLFVQKATEKQMERYLEFFDPSVLAQMLQTLHERSEQERPSLTFIGKIFDKLQPDLESYLPLVKQLVKYYTPHELLAFFEQRVAKDEKSFRAYLYILVEFEMIDKVQELLQDTPQEEHQDFKAYLDLRRAGKHYPITLFV